MESLEILLARFTRDVMSITTFHLVPAFKNTHAKGVVCELRSHD